jgi:uncharacterized membrane protein
MTADERIDRLEHRLQVLEGLVRQMVASQPTRDRAPSAEFRAPISPPARVAPPPPPEAPSQAAAQSGAPSPRRSLGAALSEGRRPFENVLSEQWLGQRGLLSVGVIFVVLAAGYLLKLSFDRGWVSPLVRCAGGSLIGAGLGALGWRIHDRGYRAYGAALMGTGAAVIYLAVWAAARLYQFLAPTPAILALAAVSLGLAAVAVAIDIEALCAAAALGAFFAPVLVGREGGSVNLLLLYLGAIGATLGMVAARRHWRVASGVVALAYFGIAGSRILGQADATALYWYAVIGGAAGLYLGLREGWMETRLLSFGGGWTVLSVAHDASSTPAITVLGGLVLTAPVWWRALTADTVWPRRGLPGGRSSLGDSFYFYLSPLLVGWALSELMPALAREHRGLVAAMIALPYLWAGWSQFRPAFALLGAAALAVAAVEEWSGLGATIGLLLPALVWAAADHSRGRLDGRWYALGNLLLALLHLVATDYPARGPQDPAFVGRWALVLWAAVAVAVILAAGLWRTRDPAPDAERRVPAGLWLLAGLLLLFGVTGELTRAFDLAGLDLATADLAGGLAVSAWWICFAAACFAVGFRRRLRGLRYAGFAVAALALAKVALVDLSRLDALYRVGSAAILGAVSLAVAYRYHRAPKGWADR